MASHTPEELEQALAALRDIHLPAPPDPWRAANDLMGTLALLAVAALAVWLARRYVLVTPHVLALRELERIRRAHRRGQPPAITLRACGSVVRRFVLALYPVSDVAGLSGEQWLAFLDRAGGAEAFFQEGLGHVLAQGPFQPAPPPFDAERLLAGLARWVRRVHGPPRTWHDKLLHPRRGLPSRLYP
jgi:hypothetical protein